MIPGPSIEVRLNGKSREIPEGLTLLGLLKHLEIKQDRVAIEFNREIVKAELWGSTPIHAGDELEVVHFVGGGR
ncbi:MAG: sulfur carrier protein ThiS [Bryobacterales bacterium]|nr:sulfur carrier protein ThiS [Bryobacterales bacterium]